MHRLLESPRSALLAVAALVLLGGLPRPAHAFPVTLGLRGGSTIPNLHAGDDNPISNGWSSRLAPTFGLTVEIPFTSSWSLETGLDYAPQGAQRNGMQPVPGDYSALGLPPGTVLYANYDNLEVLDYLEVPLLARLRFGAAHLFFVEAGPFAGFLLSSRNQTRGTSSLYYDAGGTQPVEYMPGVPVPPLNFNSDTDTRGDVHPFNWGVQAGLGVTRSLGPGAIELEARGGYGLAVVQRDTGANGTNNTGNLVITIGYAIPLVRR